MKYTLVDSDQVSMSIEAESVSFESDFVVFRDRYGEFIFGITTKGLHFIKTEQGVANLEG